MLDNQGRVTIEKALMARAEGFESGAKVYIYFNPKEKNLQLSLNEKEADSNWYFVQVRSLDDKGRICLPTSIKKIFLKAQFLPVEKDGKIYILIIND